jgi:hypothetical protein
MKTEDKQQYELSIKRKISEDGENVEVTVAMNPAMHSLVKAYVVDGEPKETSHPLTAQTIQRHLIKRALRSAGFYTGVLDLLFTSDAVASGVYRERCDYNQASQLVAAFKRPSIVVAIQEMVLLLKEQEDKVSVR